MEIVKNPAYLRFVKYEHWLAFAGILLIVLQIAVSPFETQQAAPFIVATAFCIAGIILTIQAHSYKFFGIRKTWTAIPAILLIGSIVALLPFNGGFSFVILGWMIQEIFWRGIILQVFQRQGFSKLLSVIITALLSATSYYLILHSTGKNQYFVAFIFISLISGFLKVRFTIFESIIFFVIMLWTLFLGAFD